MRRRTIAAALLAVALLVLLGLWTQRKPIARGFVDDALRARGVRAAYDIAALGPGVQRLENLVIGDPAKPDLVAASAELHLRYELTGPKVARIVARGVRLRGRLADGRLSLGAVDRLLPPPSGKPFALPDIAIDVADARAVIATPAGPIGLALDGRGRLTDGFRGRIAGAMPVAVAGGCRINGGRLYLEVEIDNRQPTFAGPVSAATADCPALGVNGTGVEAIVDARLAQGLDRWSGMLLVGARYMTRGPDRLEDVRGRVGFAGDRRETRGELRLIGAPTTRFGVANQLAIEGDYRVGARLRRFAGNARVEGARTAPGLVAPVSAALTIDDALPVGPLASRVRDAVGAAARRFDATIRVAYYGTTLRLAGGELNAASGARLAFEGGAAGLVMTPAGMRIDGTLRTAGGGLPEAAVLLRQAAPGGALAGFARVAPYAAGGARLALTPVRFGGDGRRVRIDTVATLDGPLGDGAVRGLTLPIAATLDTDAGSFIVNPRCAPLNFARLSIAGLDLGPSRLPLCPVDDAMLRGANGRFGGGAMVSGLRLAGRLGDQPVRLVARRFGFHVGRRGFEADAVAVRLGGDEVTRLDIARLDGRVDARGLGGRFEGAAGQLANVPLLLSEGAGGWRLDGGRLTLDARLRVADVAPEPRFNPLTADDVVLTLVDGRIRVDGSLRAPATGTLVSRVGIDHDLTSGRGGAILDVPGIAFIDGFQPEALTRLTLGVIANVQGSIKGRGRIDWTPVGVTSSGDFTTDRLDFAAAFGPVTGLAGTIHFSDLLNLETPPGQEVTIAEVNPGTAITGGSIRYRLLAGQKVAIEGGSWPFSGGTLTLDPAVIDFGQPVARRLAFRVEGLDAALFVQRFGFENIAVTGTFDGVMPIVFDESGGRIEGGRLAVREAGGTLAYVGEVSNADLGMFGKLAFDALKAMRYQSLVIELDGALDGELVSRVLFTGTNEAPKEGGDGLLSSLTGLPFKFNITIRAPFRGLIGAVQSFNDPRALIDQALPGRQPELPGSSPPQPQFQVQPRPQSTTPDIQPRASEDMP